MKKLNKGLVLFLLGAILVGAALVAGGAAIDAGYWSLVATRIDANNQGRGVYIEMTRALVFNITPQ